MQRNFPKLPALRLIRGAFVAAFAAASILALAPAPAAAQTIMDKLKALAQKPAGQPAAKPGQAAPAKPGQAGAPDNGTAPFTPPAGTNIQSTVVGPFSQGTQYIVSPHGVHVATLANSGSRWVINYDGVEGPKFDQVYGQGAQTAGVKYSPDGSHYAYCALSGSDYVVMADGKEIFRDNKTGVQNMITDMSCANLGWSANSKHVYFTSSIKATSSMDAPRFVWDGQASPVGADGDYRNYGFSPDGNHFAYTWINPSDPSGPQKLIVDGKPVAYFATNPQWSPDSAHLYTTQRIGGGKPIVNILFDGKIVMSGDDIRLYMPPVGSLGIARIGKSSGIPNPYSFLVIGGKQVPGSNPGRNGVGDIVFSADGKHYASIFVDAQGHQSVFADGKRGQTYSRIDPVTIPTQIGTGPQKQVAFTGDGTVVYVGDNAAGGQFLVIGDQEANSITGLGLVSIAPVGSHVLAAGSSQVAVDGKLISLSIPGQVYDPMMGSDGSHYGFAVRARGAIFVYFDGVAQAQYGAVEANQSIFVLSPDGHHIAYICQSANPAGGGDTGICVDGKYNSQGPSGGSLGDLTFSADSNHLMWTRRVGRGIRIYADGKPVLDAGMPSTAGFHAETLQTDGNSGWLMLVQDGTSFKRVSLTPSPSTSLATMGGS
jgi:hypothetical protein